MGIISAQTVQIEPQAGRVGIDSAMRCSIGAPAGSHRTMRYIVVPIPTTITREQTHQIRLVGGGRAVTGIVGGDGRVLMHIIGIRTAVVHAYAGILSAYGMGLADVVVEKQAPCSHEYGAAGVAAALDARLAALEDEARAELRAEGFPDAAQAPSERYLHMRYEGTDNALMVARPADGDYAAAMAAAFKREFGFALGAERRLRATFFRTPS